MKSTFAQLAREATMSVSYTNPGGMHVPSSDGRPSSSDLRIERVTADRRRDAVERLVSDVDSPGKEAARRFLEFSRDNNINLDNMWVVLERDGEAIRRTLLAVPSPGRTAMIFMTRLHRADEVPEAGLLIRSAMAELAGTDVHLAQVLLDPRDELERQAFLVGEFTELAHLSYLERPVPALKDVKPIDWPKEVTVEKCRDPHDREWAEVLERTYEQTLDCPGLLGLRQTSDIIEGHRSIGVFDPGLWTLVRVNGVPAGVLLLNPVPASRSVELVYLGMVPEARGTGLAARLLRYGLGLLAGRPERTVTLAVDDQNTPAMRLYHAQGFRRSLRRVALIRALAGTSDDGDARSATP